ncbi:hypothetical protein MGH68_14835 [Erysipelothrix sp. D19-032]
MLVIKLSNDESIEKVNVNLVRDIVNPPLQKIYFGAPGTGKSHNISTIICDHLGLEFTDINNLPNVFRTTIFSDFTYHDFIGSIMPVINQNDKIEYAFEPGVFTKVLSYAFGNPNIQTYLVLEEMTRGNMASIFGDVFQLLDRDENGMSTYFINNELIAKELNKETSDFFDVETDSYKKIYLPANLSILGTINSTDQSVFPMDTRFKRRFDFEYVSTEPVFNDDVPLNDFEFKFQNKTITWVDFYQRINKFIIEDAELSKISKLASFS